MRIAIIIPARYGSTRLEGKPLIPISGQTMLQRVVRLSLAAVEGLNNTQVMVATDDERIASHCRDIHIPYLMTPPEAPTGTDRVAQAVKQLRDKPDFILNMQGDAPLTPPDFLRVMIHSFMASPCEVLTPVTQLTWTQLDALRENKRATPFSGTTALMDEKTGQAYWFSKMIMPAIRNEEALRQQGPYSPIYRHIGLYGYSLSMLETYVTLPEGHYEKIEGIEQLRILENGYRIRCVKVDYQGRASMSGVDSIQDVARAEALIEKHGEL